MIAITPALLSALSPQTNAARKASQAVIVSGVAPAMQASFGPAGISTTLRVANFLAQVCEECDSFCTMLEYDSGAAYNGRVDLGNTRPGDGPRFKGRGIIMLTGRNNYTFYGKLLSLDLVNNPGLAAEPANAVTIAIAYWNQNNLNPLADRNDIVDITRRINGGLNGLSTRQLFLARARKLLSAPAPVVFDHTLSDDVLWTDGFGASMTASEAL